MPNAASRGIRTAACLGTERRAARLDRAPYGRVALLDRGERLVDRFLRDAGDPDARLSEADTGDEVVDRDHACSFSAPLRSRRVGNARA